ncbi:histidine--tRNA ligase [Candidatus Fermentibacteria bacterium]|nr:histidine--tRNA ligase [Candidatus Fermentibacteria bacterium]
MDLRKKPLQGMRQLYPEDMRVDRYVLDALHSAGEAYGFEEFDAPVIEPLDLFLAKSGNELAVEQSYHFQDKSGRELILRPELTPSLARMVASAGELLWPVKWMSFPLCYRYERPQRGRAREFRQFNCDILGCDSLQAELEMFLLLRRSMEGLGVGDDIYEIAYSSRRLAAAALVASGFSEDEMLGAFHLVDRREKMPAEEWEEYVVEEVGDDDRSRALLRFARCRDVEDPWLEDAVGDTEAYEEIVELNRLLEEVGVAPAVFDASVVRGLDYYTGVVFEVADTGGRNRRALCGGGRYDDLVGLFGGKRISGVGFGLGMLTLRLFLESYDLIPQGVKESSPTTLFMTVMSDQQRGYALRLAEKLRSAGVSVEMDMSGRNLSRQFKLAGKRGVPLTAVVGPDEAASGTVGLKDMESSSQEEVKADELPDRVKAFCKDSDRDT